MDNIDDAYGVIYKTTNNVNGRYYIGKKCLHKGKAWDKYWGSSIELIADMKYYGKHNFSKEIIHQCNSSYDLSYWEIDAIIKHNWLSTQCYNQNISGKYFKSKITI